MQEVLKSYLDRIRTLSAEAKQRLQAELGVEIADLTGVDKEAAQDLFEDQVQTLPDFDDLVNDIMDEIRLRLEGIASELRTHASGWPLAWEYTAKTATPSSVPCAAFRRTMRPPSARF